MWLMCVDERERERERTRKRERERDPPRRTAFETHSKPLWRRKWPERRGRRLLFSVWMCVDVCGCVWICMDLYGCV